MPDAIDWSQLGDEVATDENPQFKQPDLSLLNSFFGGQLSQNIPQPDGIDWNQLGDPVEQPAAPRIEQQPSTDQEEEQKWQQFRDRLATLKQQTKLDQIAQTRSRIQAEDAARAPIPDENFNPETGAAAEDQNLLSLTDEALLGAAQGAAGFGRQLGGAVRALGPASAVGGLLGFFGGARKVGKAIADYSSEQLKQYQEAGQADPTDSTGKVINWLASSATGLAPIVAAGAVGGLPLVVATMGAQSFGGTYENAVERYQQDGLTEDQAAQKAYLPAVISGAVSAAIGHAVGPTGLGALANKALAGTTIRQIVGTILRDAGLGGAQGLTDTLAQGIIQKATYDPERSWSEIVPDALESGAGGVLLGGLASGAHQTLGAYARAAQGEPPNQSVVTLGAKEATGEAAPQKVSLSAQVAAPLQPAQRSSVDGPIQSFLGRRVAYAGYDGVLSMDESGQTILNTDDGKAVEVAGGKGDAKISDLGVKLSSQRQGVFLPDGTITVDGIPYKNPQFNQNKQGNIVSLTAERPDGSPIDIRDPQLALDLGIQAANHAANLRLAGEPNSHRELNASVAEADLKHGIGVKQFYDQLNPVVDYVDEGLSLLDASAKIGRQQFTGSDVPEVQRAAAQRLAPETLRIAKASLSHVIEQIEGSKIGAADMRRATDPLYEMLDQIEQYEKQHPVKSEVNPPNIAETKTVRSAEPIPPEPPTQASDGAAPTAGARSEPVQPNAQSAPKPASTGVERPPDILDQIVDNYGTIQAKKTARKGTEGYYGDVYAMVREQRPRLFSQKGITPDRVVDNLRRDGLVGEDFSVDDLWDEIHKANRARSAHFKGELPEQKESKFHQLLTDAEKAKKHYVVSVGDLEVGTRFKIKGESFTVKNIDPDTGSVQVQDGPKFGHQVIPDGADIHVQKGTLKNQDKPLTVDQAWPTEPEKAPSTVPTLRSGENQGDLLSKQQEDFALVGQKGTDFEAIQKAKAKAEADRAEASKGQSDMFGQLAKGWTEASGETDQGPKESKYQLRFDPKEVVRGHDALRALVNAPDSGVTGIALKAFNALLDNPNLRDLFGSIGVAIHDGGRGFAGLADITNGILHLSKSFASVETASHEVFHFVYDRLPDFMKQQVEASRLAALEKHFGGNIPSEFRNGMSSVEWKSKGYPSDTYPLINASEHLATFAGETLGKEAAKPTTLTGKIAATVRGWVQAIADTLARLTGQQYDLGRVVRDVLSGKIKLNADTAGEGEHASYVDTAARAENAAKQAKNDNELKREGYEFASGHAEHLDSLLRAGASKASDKVKRLLGLNNKIGIVTKSSEILGRNVGYTEAQANLDPISQRINAIHANAAYEAADRNRRGLEAKAKETADEIARPGFLKKVDRQFLNSFKIETMEDAQSKTKSILTTVLNVAKQANKDKALNDVERARLQGQLQEVTEAGKSSSALSGLVQDMTRILASTPDGLALLENGGPRAQFRKVYSDLKRSVDQPLHSESLMNWGSYLMEKAPKLRAKLLASELAQDPNVQAALTTFQDKFLTAYKKDPTKAVMAEVRAQTSLAGNLGKAKFAWKLANEPLLKKFQNAQDYAQAAEIAGKALDDTSVVKLRQGIRKDSGAIGSQERANTKTPFNADSDIVFPSGKTISLSGESFGDEFNRLRTEAVAGLKEIEQHLADNDPGSPNYEYYLRARDTLHATLESGSALKLNDPMKVHNSTFGILWNVLYTSGGRLANALKGTWARAEQIGQKAQHWTHKWGPITMQKRLAAIASHPEIKFGTGRAMNFIQAHELWWNQVGNETAWSGNRQGDALQVGDPVGTLGWKLTGPDLEAIRSQTKATDEGYEAAGGKQVTLDETAGKNAAFSRSAAKPGVYGTVRDSARSAAPFAADMSKATEAYRAAKTEFEKAAALDRMDQAFSDNFGQHAKAYTQNRDYALVGDNATPLDGRGGAFETVLPSITDGSILTAQEYFQALAEASGHSVDEVKAMVLPDLGRMASAWHKVFTADTKIIETGSGHETKNSFSLARGNPVAPYSFYNYGFHDGNALKGFGAHIYSRAFDEVLNGLDALVKDLQRMQLDRDRKVNAEVAKGNPNARKTVEARQDHDRRMDLSFDNYRDIEHRIRLAVQMRDRLNRHDTVTTPEGIVLRGLQNLIGASLGSGAAFNDIVMNPYYLGRSVLRVKGGYGKAGVLTAAADFDSKLRAAASVTYSGIKSGLNLILADPSETLAGAHTGSKGIFSGGLVGAVVHAPFDRSLALFVNRLVIPFVHEWGDHLHTRMFNHRKFVEHGIDPVSSTALEVSNRIMGGLANAGESRGDPNAQPGALSRASHTLLGAWELLAKSVIGSTYRLNDTTMNQNTRNVYDGWIGSRLGPTAQFTDALKQMAVRVKEGHRPWDRENWDNPINELSPKEMLGSKTATRTDKYRAIDAHDRAGIDYRRLAHKAVNEYVDGDKAHKPYDEAKTYQLIHEMALYENKQSKINESNILKNSSVAGRALGAYQSWATRQLSNFAKMGEMADSVTHGKNESQARRAQVIAFAGMALNLMALVGAGAGVTVLGNAARRVFMKAMFNQVTAAPQPWERKGTAAQTKGWALAGLNTIPYIGTIANAMFDDLATRAAYDPSIAMLEKVKTMGQYVGGTIQSKDPFYRLAETVESIVPDSKIVLNRLESQSGKRENINEANLLRRYADPDTVKPIGGRNFQVTPLTPYGAKMVNAAVNGDTAELQRIRDEAVQVATALGKEKPEQAVEQMFRNQMAETKALKNKPTQEQRDAILGQMSPSERALVDRVESNYSAGAQALGMREPNLVKLPAQRSSGSRASQINVGPARLGSSRVPRIRGLQVKRGRSARIHRSRLARSGRRLRTFA